MTTTPPLAGGGANSGSLNAAEYSSSLRVPLLEDFDLERGNVAGVSELGVSQVNLGSWPWAFSSASRVDVE